MRKPKGNPSALKQTLATANKFMQQSLKECRALLDSNHVRPFNSDLRGTSPVECFNALSIHRFVNKYSVPDQKQANERKLRCFTDWIKFEDELYKFNFNDSIHKLAPADLTVLNRARYRLKQKMKNWRFKPESFGIYLTPGETFRSQQGEVSLVHKFKNKDNWTLTYSAIDAAVDMINFSRGCLLNSLVHHYCVDPDIDMPTDFSFDEWKLLVAETATRNDIYRMLCHVCTFTEGARAGTVPKSISEDRFINCEAFLNVILQRGLSVDFLTPFLRAWDNNLKTAQHDHKKLISQPCATIDFKKASDSVHYDCVKFFFDDRVFEHITSIRSYSTYIPGLELTIPNAKISPMGNGFTFEVMTTILLAIARELDSNARVCGDDVIICNEQAHTFVRLANAVGFTVNNTKTFINSDFRESCGGFYHDDFGYLETYELTHIASLRDLYTTCNKLHRMISHAPEGAEIKWMEALRRNLMHLVPAFAKGPAVKSVDEVSDHDFKEDHGLDCGYVISDNWLKSQRSCASARETFKQKSLMHSSLLWEYYHCKMVGLLKVPVWCPKGRWAATELVSHAEYAGYLYGLRRPRLTIRGKGKWKTITYLVTDSGFLISCNYLASLRTEVHDLGGTKPSR